MKIKILQWNIWKREKISNILSVLKKINPDIICIQELSENYEANPKVNTGKYIEDNLNFFSYYKTAQTWGDGYKHSQGNGIFTKFPILNTYSCYLQDFKIKPIDSSDEGRIYVGVSLKIKNKNFEIGTTHLSYTKRFITNEKKKLEISKLIDVIKLKNENFIFTGDLNSGPSSYAVKKISKVLKNCGPDYQYKTWTTKPFSYNGFKESDLRWRLDYIFSSKDVVVSSAKIYDTSFSDHLPILVEVKI